MQGRVVIIFTDCSDKHCFYEQKVHITRLDMLVMDREQG